MTWTAPATPTGGTVITVSFYNTNIRDNLTQLRTPSGARVYNSAAISIPQNNDTLLTFDSERYDNGGCHSVATNTGRLTAPEDGVYLICGTVSWAAGSNATIALSIYLNGVTRIAAVHIPAINADPTWMTIPTLYFLSAGDWVGLYANQDGGGNQNILAVANYSPEFMMARVGG